jgi:hypothetical protein
MGGSAAAASSSGNIFCPASATCGSDMTFLECCADAGSCTARCDSCAKDPSDPSPRQCPAVSSSFSGTANALGGQAGYGSRGVYLSSGWGPSSTW